MILQSINKFFSGFRKYLFTYKEGFFELPFMANSPAVMLESIKKMPFNKHSVDNQTVTTNNPFTEGTLHYQNFEEGLGITIVDMRFKANCNFVAIYDEYLPKDYFFITLQINQNNYPTNSAFVNGLKYPFKAWAFHKPARDMQAYHFKGSHGLFFNILFNQEWLNNNILNNSSIDCEVLNSFLNSDNNYLIWPDLEENAADFYQNFYQTILNKEEDKTTNIAKLRTFTIDFMTRFVSKMNLENTKNEHLEIPQKDRRKIAKAHKIINDNLFTAFPGIENIATEVNIAPTNLKTYFKLIYGDSIYQYYKDKQMQYANAILETDDKKIVEVAQLFGYENASKFAIAFKKKYGILPSKVVKTVK